jgi:hypothetical protein
MNSNRLLSPRKRSVPDPQIFLTDPDPWIHNPTDQNSALRYDPGGQLCLVANAGEEFCLLGTIETTGFFVCMGWDCAWVEMLRSGLKEGHQAASWSLQKAECPVTDIKPNIHFLGGMWRSWKILQEYSSLYAKYVMRKSAKSL